MLIDYTTHAKPLLGGARSRDRLDSAPKVFGVFLAALEVRDQHFEISEAQKQLTEVLTPLNLKTVDTKGGGDCLYHAVANASGQGMIELRNKLHNNLQSIANSIELASREIEGHVGDNLERDAGKLRQDFNDKSVQKSAQHKVPDPVGERDGWGYDRHLRALAHLEKRPIVVINGAGARIFRPDFKIENQYTQALGGNGVDRNAWGKNAIVLANRFNHYENVVPASGHRPEPQNQPREATMQNGVLDNPWLDSNNDEKHLDDVKEDLDEIDELGNGSLFKSNFNDDIVGGGQKLSKPEHRSESYPKHIHAETKSQVMPGLSKSRQGGTGSHVGGPSEADFSRQAHLEQESEQLTMVDGKLKETLAEKQRLFDAKTAWLRHLNHQYISTQFHTPRHVLRFMNNETGKNKLFKAVRAAQNDKQAKKMHASLKPGILRRAWRALKTVFVDHANDVKEVSKVSSKALSIHQEAADLGGLAADRLDGPITHFDVTEKFFGMVKSGMGFYKKMRAALKEPSLIRDWEQPQQDTVDTLREAPFRMLAKRKAEANEYVSAWQGLDIVKEGIGTVRYTTDSAMKAGKEAALRGNETTKGMSKTALGIAQKQGSQLAGAGLSAYGAMKGTVEALDLKKENKRRKAALQTVEQQFPPRQNQPVDPSIQDLRAVHKLGVRNAQVVTKSVGVAKDALNATAYGFGAAVAFGAKSTLVTSWAPPLALSAASAAILYGSGKEIAAYNARSLKALHRDAMAGRVGPTTKQQLESEAPRKGFPTGKDYLDHLLIRQDVRYATRRLLINLKREMRAGDSSGDLVSRLEQRRLAAPEKERKQDPLSIYRPPSDSNFAKDDAQRIERSPTAHFLEQMGMSRAEVVALADSADDEATNEACRQLIQIQLKLKG